MLAARDQAPRLLWPALLFFALIAFGSVDLGFHYAIDGIAGVIGAIAAYGLGGTIIRRCRVADSAE